MTTPIALAAGPLGLTGEVDVILSITDFEGESGRAMFHFGLDPALTLAQIAYAVCATDGTTGLALAYQQTTNGAINSATISLSMKASNPTNGVNTQWANTEDEARCQVLAAGGGSSKITIHAPVPAVFVSPGETVDTGGTAPVPVFVAAGVTGFAVASGSGTKLYLADEDGNVWTALKSGRRSYRPHKRSNA